MSEWQTIETAPEDGTVVLLGYLDKSGKFAARSAFLMADVHHGRLRNPCPAWVCSLGNILVDQRATHWMPLPSQPEAVKT